MVLRARSWRIDEEILIKAAQEFARSAERFTEAVGGDRSKRLRGYLPRIAQQRPLLAG